MTIPREHSLRYSYVEASLYGGSSKANLITIQNAAISLLFKKYFVRVLQSSIVVHNMEDVGNTNYSYIYLLHSFGSS